MTRTSLILPDSLQQRLALAAKFEGVSVSHLIRDLIIKALDKREEARLDQLYDAFEEMEGMAEQPNVTDASITIDDVLYGGKGAWRGSER